VPRRPPYALRRHHSPAIRGPQTHLNEWVSISVRDTPCFVGISRGCLQLRRQASPYGLCQNGVTPDHAYFTPLPLRLATPAELHISKRKNCSDNRVQLCGPVKLDAHGLYASRNKSNYRVGDLLLWVVGVCLLLLHCLERPDGNGNRRNGRCWTILAMGEHMNPGRTTQGNEPRLAQILPSRVRTWSLSGLPASL
jgi:hypothetical protein